MKRRQREHRQYHPHAGRVSGNDACTARLRRVACWLALGIGLNVGIRRLDAQPAPPPNAGGHTTTGLDSSRLRHPFAIGEALTYRVSVTVGGTIGTGQMRVEGPDDAHGVQALRFVSEMQVKRGFLRATDRTVSWVDPARFATVRFEKRERHPWSDREEQVDIDIASGTWRDRRAAPRLLASPDPLDELSFLYFLRTLTLDQDTVLRFTRHFDLDRNPTLVSIGPEEIVDTPRGRLHTRVVVMHVRDPAHYQGIGLIRINLEMSPCRLPVRIVSKVPIVGTTTLLLTEVHGTGCE